MAMSPRIKNILKGVGSVLEIYPPSILTVTSLPYTPPDTDTRNLWSDMEKIGRDFHQAMESATSGKKNKK